MQKEFSLNSDKAMINFTARYCETHEELLESKGFKKVLTNILSQFRKKEFQSILIC